MLVIFFFACVSIFIPPFWLITLAYIIYLVATKKKRRDQVIMGEIENAIKQKKESFILEHLYFDSAKKFAIEHGATPFMDANFPSEESWNMELSIAGQVYQIKFQRGEYAETWLSVCGVKNVIETEKHKNKANVAVLLLKNSA